MRCYWWCLEVSYDPSWMVNECAKVEDPSSHQLQWSRCTFGPTTGHSRKTLFIPSWLCRGFITANLYLFSLRFTSHSITRFILIISKPQCVRWWKHWQLIALSEALNNHARHPWRDDSRRHRNKYPTYQCLRKDYKIKSGCRVIPSRYYSLLWGVLAIHSTI